MWVVVEILGMDSSMGKGLNGEKKKRRKVEIRSVEVKGEVWRKEGKGEGERHGKD